MKPGRSKSKGNRLMPQKQRGCGSWLLLGLVLVTYSILWLALK